MWRGQAEMIAVAGQELLYYISDERCLYTTNIVTRDCDMWRVTCNIYSKEDYY